MNTTERRLIDLGERLDWPETADLTKAVQDRVSAPRPTHRPQRRLSWAVAAAMIVAISFLASLAPVRQAAAGLLGILGIRIEQTGPIVDGLGFDLDLGAAVTLEEAQAMVDFPLRRPDNLSPPDVIYLDPGKAIVSMVWSANDDLPDVGDTGVGLILTQFRGDSGGFVKQAPPDATVIEATVGDDPGFWIEGGPHALTYVDAAGEVQSDTTRLAGNVLIWPHLGVSHRLESMLDLGASAVIAESLSVP